MAGFAQVIKYEGDNETCIWKHEAEDFNSGTQLIVHESQEAVFFMNGQALDSFGPGRYTLETQNIPLISRIFNQVTGGDAPFHCEVYFINKAEQMAVKWGTDTKMEYMEPIYGFPIKLGACGEMNLRIEDGRKVLIKVVGTEEYLGQNDLVRKLRAFLILKLKTYMVTYIRENRINIFRIDEHLQIMSDAMRNALLEDFSEYGMTLEHFFITTVMKPEDDPNYLRFKDLHFRQYADIAEAKLQQQLGIIGQQTEAQKRIIEAQALAQKRSIEGYTYQQERQFDVAEGFANNEGVGEFANMGVGLGMISGIGNAVGDKLGGVIQSSVSGAAAPAVQGENKELKCLQCGAAIPANGKFCLECGTKLLPPPGENEMICPQCRQKVAKGKFCPECGASLAAKCTNCHSELPAGAKFCFECGTKVN
ncbi:MAG: SPFH domain-containing protein [Lentisphaeria bacterium]|nr:SPFH domain-containing protein [Lentisphaeria bacterium]